ncbi:hypothetical protein N9C10_04405 [Flavobacteriaceae bacterium]|nr:hypothetical protein [Flavobacteriaceae bacterium]
MTKPPPPYRPIDNFESYANACMEVAKERYAVAKETYDKAVTNLRRCRSNNLGIRDELIELHGAMVSLQNLDLKKEEERLLKMRELQEIQKTEDPPDVPSRMSLLPKVEMDRVHVELKVQKKSKNVKVKLTTPLMDLREKYYKNLKRPPIVEKIRVYHKLGYPDWYLEKMLESQQKQVQKKPEMETWFRSVFDKYDAKKPSKAKPKTMLQKLKPTPTPTASTEEFPPPKRGLVR